MNSDFLDRSCEVPVILKQPKLSEMPLYQVQSVLRQEAEVADPRHSILNFTAWLARSGVFSELNPQMFVIALEVARDNPVSEDLARRLFAEAARRLSAMPDTDGEAASNSGDTSPDGVKAHIEKTIDHLQHHRVTDAKQMGDLKKAVEQADRVKPSSDAAIGRIRGNATGFRLCDDPLRVSP